MNTLSPHDDTINAEFAATHMVRVEEAGSKMTIPVAIVIAGAIIGAGIYFGNVGATSSPGGVALTPPAGNAASAPQSPAPSGPVDVSADDDPFLGNADGLAAGVSGTPTVFINGRIVVGAQPFSSFAKVIDEELKK